jgi:hypothetical protein
MDGGHVQGFIKVFFPRLIHWIKGKGTVKKVFHNGRLERRPFSVDLRSFESALGKSVKGRWILGIWSLQMSFKKRSSKVEGEFPSSEFARKARGKGFGMVSFQSVVRA